MNSINRITGFSGFDTESLVQKLITAERAPLDKLKFKEQQTEWKQDMYRDINKSFKALFDMADKIRMNANWSKFKITSSNESTVSASGGTAAGPHTVEVFQLSDSARLTGAASMQGGTVTSPLNGIQGSMIVGYNGEFRDISIAAGEIIDNDSDGDVDLYDAKNILQQKINNEFGLEPFGNNLIDVSTDGSKFTLTPNSGSIEVHPFGSSTLIDELGFNPLGQSNALSLSSTIGSSFSLKINGKQIDFTAGQTYQQVMDTINAKSSETNVKMTFNPLDGVFSFFSTKTGSTAEAKLETLGANGDNFLNSIGFSTSNRQSIGKDAVAVIDGSFATGSINTVEKDGVTYTLKDITPGTPVTINVNRDIDALVKQVTDYVNKYNETIELISGKLKEKMNRKIKPMSDEDRKNIKEADLKLWETEAKKGLLRSDDILSHALQEMRSMMYSGVAGVRADGKESFLSQFGITTASFTGESGKIVKSKAAMDGMLVVDEEKLRKALSDNPDTVIKTFTNYPPSGTPDRDEKVGLGHRLKDLFDKIQDDISLKIDNKEQVQGENDYSLEKDIRVMKKRMEDMEEHLLRKENEYYKRFAAMEKAMNQANSQGAWIASQMMK